MTKKDLREEFIHKRICLNEEDKSFFDETIFGKLVNNEHFKQCDCVLTYVSTNTEVDTKSIIEYSLMKGKIVAVPRCEKDSNLMSFYRISSLNDLEKGSFNILEPNHFCSELIEYDNAVCIVPGLCFDKDGYRLGYGRGYYDRFLSEYPVYSIGLCYKSFLIEKIPTDSFDIPVDCVLTD